MKEKENDRIWQLLARRTAGEILPEEREELDQLMQENPDASFVEEVLLYGWSDKFKPYDKEEKERLLEKHKIRLQAVDAGEEITGEERRTDTGRTKRISFLRYGSVAAAITLTFFAIRKYSSHKNDAVSPDIVQFTKEISTPKGARTRLTLPDSSVVWLNASSTLEYENTFKGSTRNVRLKGEAYFEIAKDSNRPFFVHTSAFNLKVLGTGFNVRAYPDEDSATASLVHGSVEVITPANKQRILLRPNEKIILPVNEEGKGEVKERPLKTLARNQPVELRPRMMTPIQDSLKVETAWVQNTLAFKKMPLTDVATLLENWYNVTIRFKNEKRKTLRFTGVFKNEPLNNILVTLEATGSFSYTRDKDGIIWIE